MNKIYYSEDQDLYSFFFLEKHTMEEFIIIFWREFAVIDMRTCYLATGV